MIYTYDGIYSVALCRLNPDHLFLFGDNLHEVGKGGQAVIRDEPNAYGIPTKKRPSNNEGDFFDGGVGEVSIILGRLADAVWFNPELKIVMPVLADGKPSLGCGLAQLPERSPKAYEAICNWLAEEETQPFAGRLPREAPDITDPYAFVVWNHDDQRWEVDHQDRIYSFNEL